MELTNISPKRQKPFLLETFEHSVTGKPVAKLLPRPAVTLSPISIPIQTSIQKDSIKIVWQCQKYDQITAK